MQPQTPQPFVPTFVPAHYDEGWEYQPDLCPADDHFIEWWETTNYQIIFHMGPGLHHKVGQHIACIDTRIMSYTVSPQEMATYAQLPDNIRRHYHCYHRDVNDTRYDPNIHDVVTLFHLGEYQYDPPLHNSTYEATIKRFAESLWQGGVLVAYLNSSAADRIIPIFDNLYPIHTDFKSLRIYTPT